MTSIPLKWHGGKYYLAPKIINRIPKHIHYVEPYFGSGAVLFAKNDEMIFNHSEVINDIHCELTTFYCVLQNADMFTEFCKRIEVTPFSQIEWGFSKESNEDSPHVTRALKFFVLYRQSRQGIGKSFATLSRNRTRRGMNEQAASWLSAIEGLQEAHLRLRGVVILNEHAIDVIRGQDGSNTFFYLDPPYLQATRSAKNVYTHEMRTEQHRELLETLSTIQGKFILSGYFHPLYDNYAMRHKWQRDDITLPNAASGNEYKELRVESLWYNF